MLALTFAAGDAWHGVDRLMRYPEVEKITTLDEYTHTYLHV